MAGRGFRHHCRVPLLLARRRVCCLVLLVPLVLAACGDSTPGASLGDAVLSSVGSGYAIPSSGPNGALSVDQVASATPASPSAVKQRLAGPDFAGAFERVWRRQDEFVTIIVLGFVTQAKASAFAAFEVQSIAASGTAEVFPAGLAPDEHVFTFAGATRASSKTTQFCQGAWFAVQTDAVEVTHCSPDRPAYPNDLIDLANQELNHILGISAGPP